MIRDPFNIHRKNAFQATALRAAQNIRDAAAQAGATALDMSFSMPKNVPDFAAPNRDLEDRAWTAVSNSGGAAAGLLNQVQGRVAGLFDQQGLPMYKDKPYTYAPSMRRRPWWRRKRILSALLLGALTLLYLTGFFSGGDEHPRPTTTWSWMGLSQEKGGADWQQRRQHVVEAFELSWDAYERYAWGTLAASGTAVPTLTEDAYCRLR